jgi:hypothetical protein
MVDFRRFRDSLHRLTGKDAIVIPENHDQKWFGNSLGRIGYDANQLASLEWSSVVIDEDINVIFACFNSSMGADWARGRVDLSQLKEVANQIDMLTLARPEIDRFLKIALVHHHPVSFAYQAKQNGLIQRALTAVGADQEAFLRMEDAEQFMSWCFRRGFHYIMHGYKHLQFFDRSNHRHGDGPSANMTVIGSGATLGVGGVPICANILTWDDVANLRTVSFYSDPGDGSGLVEQYMEPGDLRD